MEILGFRRDSGPGLGCGAARNCLDIRALPACDFVFHTPKRPFVVRRRWVGEHKMGQPICGGSAGALDQDQWVGTRGGSIASVGGLSETLAHVSSRGTGRTVMTAGVRANGRKNTPQDDPPGGDGCERDDHILKELREVSCSPKRSPPKATGRRPEPQCTRRSTCRRTAAARTRRENGDLAVISPCVSAVSALCFCCVPLCFFGVSPVALLRPQGEHRIDA